MTRRTSLYDEIEGGSSGETGEPQGRRAFWSAPRAPMSLVASHDDGETWAGRRDLETGDGYCLSNNSVDNVNREFSYPALTEAPAASTSAFTYFRQAIKHVGLNV